MDEIIPEDSLETKTQTTPGPVPKSVTIKPEVRNKPLIEGINAPKSFSDIVYIKPDSAAPTADAGQQVPLVGSAGSVGQQKTENDSQRLIFPQSPGKKGGGVGKWLIIGFVLLLLIGGAYEGYSWYLNSHVPVIPSYSHNLSSSLPPSSSQTTAGTASSSAIALNLASSTPATATTTSPSPTTGATSTPVAVTKLTVNSTPTGYLNVRSQPGPQGKVLTQIHPGEVYVYTSKQSGWYEIILPDGSMGWVSGQYITTE